MAVMRLTSPGVYSPNETAHNGSFTNNPSVWGQ